MGAIATLNYPVWAARFPDLAPVVPPIMAAEYFAEAGLYFRNDGTGPCKDPVKQSLIMNLVTAHIATINARVNDGESSPLVGRINSASEGSVSVGTADLALPGTASWWTATKHGLSAYQAMAGYRTARYFSPRPRW